MKKILILTCVLLSLFNVCSYAESIDEIDVIKNLLETKTIKNYETILIPLQGDPENFNITDNDDLKTITFGNGIQGYSISEQKIKEAIEKQATRVEPYLEKRDKWYFPIIVSNREVAMAEIVKEENEYKVLCVASGSIFDNFVRQQKNVNLDEVKYVTKGVIINGFVINNDDVERFIDLDVSVNNNDLQTINTQEKNVVEIFSERFDQAAVEGEKTSGGYGYEGSNIFYIVVAVILISACALYLIIKRKRYN